MAKEKPYGGGRYTQSQFFSFVRSGLRSKSQRWAPIYECLNEAKRPSKSKNKRLKWEYRCASCKKWKARKEVSCDHIIPAGSLNTFEDLAGFVQRLFCEKEGLQILCSECHTKKSMKDREDKKLVKEKA